MHDLNYCGITAELLRNYCGITAELLRNYCGITAELLSNRLNYCMPEKIHRVKESILLLILEIHFFARLRGGMNIFENNVGVLTTLKRQYKGVCPMISCEIIITRGRKSC